MGDNLNIEKIIDCAVKDITKRVGGMELHKVDRKLPEEDGVCSLFIMIDGTYRFSLTYVAESRLLRTIAANMKRAPIEEESEIEMYVKEYFNILCGHIVTEINKRTASRERFGIPRYVKGIYQTADGQPDSFLELCYESEQGEICLQSIYDQ